LFFVILAGKRFAGNTGCSALEEQRIPNVAAFISAQMRYTLT